MEMIRTLIVDDEIDARENLGLLLGEFCPEVEIVGYAKNMEEAEVGFNTLKPDLVFLDIQLGTHIIFELLNRISTMSFEIIFASAHEHYALKAFKFMAIDYLLKPIDIDKLKDAVARAKANLKQRTISERLSQLMINLESMNQSQHKIALPTSDGCFFVYVNTILYCLAEGSYTRFCFTDEKQLVVSRHLKHYESLLSAYGFIRIHQSSVINIRCVKKLIRSGGGYVEMEDGKQLSVSKVKKADLEKALNLT